MTVTSNEVQPIPESLSAEARAHCEQEGIFEYAAAAIRLIPQFFPGAMRITCQVERAHEVDESWLAVDFEVRTTVNAALEQHDRYVEALLERVPWPASRKIRVTFAAV